MIDPLRIVQHRDWQTMPYVDFVTDSLRRGGFPIPSPMTQAQGEVLGYINHGRWVVDCPYDGGSMSFNLDEPYFMCPVCGNAENDRQWYMIKLPPVNQITQIENTLLARPARDGFAAPTRNWRPGETVAMLKRENRQQKLPESV